MGENKNKVIPGSIFRAVISYFFAALFSCCLFELLQRSLRISGGVREAVLITVSALLSFVLYKLSRQCLPSVVMLGAFLYIAFFFRIGESIILSIPIRSAFSPRWILGALLIWFSGIGVLIFIRLLLPVDQDSLEVKKEFITAFHLSSALFNIIYILILYYLFFLQREMDLSGNRRLNLIPLQGAFSVYWPQLRDGNFGNDVFVQFFGNLLIFTPGGFMLGIYCKKFPLWIRLLIPVLMSGMIEITQYIYNMGASDIDDFWMNVAGAWFGGWIVFFLKKRRLSITGGKEKDVFSF